MWRIAARVYIWVSDRRGEDGQGLGFFTMLMIFVVVAGGMAYVLLTSGVLESSGGAGAGAEFDASNFDPPNPLD